MTKKKLPQKNHRMIKFKTMINKKKTRLKTTLTSIEQNQAKNEERSNESFLLQ